jgi:hypothetical protein
MGLCPVPGRIGVIADEDNVISWGFPPRCITQSTKNSSAPRIDCLFTSTDFRNAHGISLVTSITTAAHVLGLGALWDEPPPVPLGKGVSAPELSYQVVPVDGKGMGVIATRRIRRGEIIMVDLPAVLIGLEFLADTKPHHRRRILKQAFKQLPAETQNKVYGLHRGTSQYEVDSILGPNSNTVVLAEGEVHVGLFTEAAVCQETLSSETNCQGWDFALTLAFRG